MDQLPYDSRAHRYSRDAYEGDFSLWRDTPGIASEFFGRLADEVAKHGPHPVVASSRKSPSGTEEQLQGERRQLIASIEALGCPIVGDFHEIARADIGRTDWANRPEFMDAVYTARDCGAWLVALNTLRFLRSHRFYTHFSDGDFEYAWSVEWPSVGEFNAFASVAFGVRLLTVAPPDESRDIIHGDATKRGMQASPKKAGRPPKKPDRVAFKQLMMPIVLRLHVEGRTPLEIERITDSDGPFRVADTTAARWIEGTGQVPHSSW